MLIIETRRLDAGEAGSMLDVVFLIVTCGFFAVSIAYAAACQRL
jgi:hypothetical protein